jgi:hypothetical protein
MLQAVRLRGSVVRCHVPAAQMLAHEASTSDACGAAVMPPGAAVMPPGAAVMPPGASKCFMCSINVLE